MSDPSSAEVACFAEVGSCFAEVGSCFAEVGSCFAELACPDWGVRGHNRTIVDSRSGMEF